MKSQKQPHLCSAGVDLTQDLCDGTEGAMETRAFCKPLSEAAGYIMAVSNPGVYTIHYTALLASAHLPQLSQHDQPKADLTSPLKWLWIYLDLNEVRAWPRTHRNGQSWCVELLTNPCLSAAPAGSEAF